MDLSATSNSWTEDTGAFPDPKNHFKSGFVDGVAVSAGNYVLEFITF